MKDDLIKVKNYLETTSDMDTRIALIRLIEVIEPIVTGKQIGRAHV